MSKTLFTLRYHWKALLIGGLGLIGACVALVAWASIERPDCRWNWNEAWFHHRTTVGHIRWCLAHNHVNINQRDQEGRTLLIRLAYDMRVEEERFGVYHPESGHWMRFDGNSRDDRMAMVRELLRWSDLDLDAQDQEGKSAWNHAFRSREGRPMAVLLVEAGTTIQLSPSSQESLNTEWVPMVNALQPRLRNPFEGKNFRAVTSCQTADCLLEKLLKD